MLRIKTLSFALALATASLSLDLPARAQSTEPPVPARQPWSFAGPFGSYDSAQLQRGFKVFRQVCSNCHQASMLAFRNLSEPGGPGYSAAQVKALAASYQIHDINDSGQPVDRPGQPSDIFPWNYPNDAAAAATLGKAPPDMSFLAKARGIETGFPRFIFDALPIPGGMYQEDGPDYIFALLNGYTKPDDRNWNLYFPGNHIAMPSRAGLPRRDCIPDVAVRTDARDTQESRFSQFGLPDHFCRADVWGEEARLGRRAW
jgi:ubiquinol-cytochrome c reductase cytochrome c1 subunit